MGLRPQVCGKGVAKMRSLLLFLLAAVGTCQPNTYFNSLNYYQTMGGSSNCPAGYQPIRDEKACKEVADAVDNKNFNAIYHYYPVNPFPAFCTTKNDDVNYYVNPNGVHTDPLVSVLCIKSSKKCSVTDGSGVSTTYPCVCGTDTCATSEVCSELTNTCEVIKGYYETERKATSCPAGYQNIQDAFACRELAEMIPGKDWGAVYSLDQMPYGCTSWNTNKVNYQVNPGGVNTEVDVAILCIKSTMTCSVTDGTGVSSSYPCVCGTDTCGTGEVCVETENICEVSKGYVETEREATSCPSGYQAITDAAACRQIAMTIGGGKYWGGVYSDSNVPHGCGTWLATRANTVNYYLNPDGVGNQTHDVENAMLCIKSSTTCSVVDGTGVSSSYPCTCGTDTCATDEVCNAAYDRCEVIKGYYEAERTIQTCPDGYSEIDLPKCWELNNKLGRTWMKFPMYSGAAVGCGSWNFDTVSYFDYPGGGAPTNTTPLNSDNALLCVADTQSVSYDPCLNPYAWGACI